MAALTEKQLEVTFSDGFDGITILPDTGYSATTVIVREGSTVTVRMRGQTLMKRVYIASRYSRKLEMRELARELEERGYIIASGWLAEGYDPNVTLEELSDDENTTLALQDIDDVISADIMVFFAEDQNNQPPRGSRHVEFGYALALGLDIYVVGDRENLFHYLTDVRVVPDTDALLEVL